LHRLSEDAYRAVILARMEEQIDAGDCWEWTGRLFWDGYGVVWYRRKQKRAHRMMYELLVGPIPDGLQIDHLCRNPKCVNPDHLEPVTQRENLLRGMSKPARQLRQTHCMHGHELTPDNTYAWRGERHCRVCRRAADSRRRPPKNA
jgi:hypothetical protein